MDLDTALERLGGAATRGVLVSACGRAEVDRALRDGDLVAVARGRYVGAATDASRALAHRVSGALAGPSAALAHGWAVKTEPERPWVAVPEHRVVPAEVRRQVTVVRMPVAPEEIAAGVLDQDRTLLHALRRLPPDEALAVADSALRDDYPHRRLAALAAAAQGPGSRQVREVAARADGRADNPFESVLRHLATESGLDVRPQVPLHGTHGFLGRPDLVDHERRLVLEADSFAWHGSRDALCRDARRYNAFVAHGWLVLRFTWEDVMLRPDDVCEVLVAVVRQWGYHGRHSGPAA